MADKLPAVFVSSTFFDLRQVRADIAEFLISQLGYRLLASEYTAFPIDPAVDTIENCRRRVADADIFVLIVGGRYGSRSDSGKSITNIEYLVARERKLPTYVFVFKEILTLLRLWETNPSADFSHAVDSPDLFVFVKEICVTDRVWVIPFESAQEIVAGLRTQLAYLTGRGVAALARFNATPEDLSGFSGDALRLILEKPDTWVGDLFCLFVHQEFNDASVLRDQHRAGTALGVGEHIDDHAVTDWMQARLREAVRSVDQTRAIVLQSINTALRSQEPQALLRAARHIGAVYRECLEWAARVRRANVPPHWHEAVELLARTYDRAVQSLEELPSNFQTEMRRILSSGIKQDVKVHLAFDIAPPDGFSAAVEHALAADR